MPRLERDDETAPMPLSPDRLINQRYAIVRLLGEGGMGTVYLVRDTGLGNRPIALKFLRPGGINSETVELFKNEFRSMTRLRHPNLAEVYDFGIADEDQRCFLTMEYVDGSELPRLPRSEVRRRFESLAVQCLRALDYIHSRDLLHNDIKPHNIMVQPPFQVKLLDFGLARAQAESAQTGLSGTIHFVAPERLRGGAVDGRSDLYSLGVVLYEVLTGSLPHEGEDTGKVVSSILQGVVRAPRTFDATIPGWHEAFVMALLALDPDHRPENPAAALELLNGGAGAPLKLDTAETYASFVTSGRFVGRDRELETLVDLATAHVESAGRDDRLPRFVALSGPSGIGKSRLLRELKHRLQLAGVRNLTGRCYEDGGVPFQPFVEVLRQLPRPSQVPPAVRPVLDQLVPPEGGEARPESPSTSGAARPPAEAIGKEEFIAGVAESLAHYAQGAPGVVFIEDLQWSDAPGVDLLEHLLLRPGPGPWLYVGSLRDTAARSAPIGSLLERHGGHPRLRQIRLNPLDAAQVTELIASMVPFEDRPEGLARLLADRTDGNPLYLEELMKALAEDGTLRRSGRTWIAESRSLEAIRLPPSLASAVAQRVSCLADEERAAAEVLSVFNRPVAPEILSRAAGIGPGPLVAAIEALDRLRLVVRETTADGRAVVGLVHSRIRDAIYEGMSDDRRRALHLAVARAIETAHAGSIEAVVEELAHHFTAAGEPGPSADYCLRAARKAGGLYYPQRQVQFLEQALVFLDPEDHARRMPALAEISKTRSNDLADPEGGLSAARTLYEEARKSGDVIHESTALREIGWCMGFLGDDRGGLDYTRRALALARTTGDRTNELWCLNTLGTTLARSGANREAVGLFDEARTLSADLGDLPAQLTVTNNATLNYLGLGEADKALGLIEETLATARSHGQTYILNHFLPNLGNARYDVGDLAGAIQAMEEALAWAREHVVLQVLIHCLDNLGNFYSQRGLHDRALRVLEEERATRREIGDRAGLPPAFDFTGNASRELGRLKDAKEQHREGLEVARRLGSRVQEGFLLAALATDFLEEGSLQAAEDSAREALAIGRELGHPRISCYALSVLARAAARRGDRKAMLTATRALTRLDGRHLRFHGRLLVNLTLGRCALAAGQPADAEREARAGLDAAGKAGFREFHWRFNALLGDARAAKELDGEAIGFYNAARDAIRQIASEIEDTAMRQDYESEETRQAVITRASDLEVTPPAGETAAGAARGDPVKMLTTIYQITQIINSILDLKELLNKVMDLAIGLVGAERGLIFLYRSESDEMEMVVARDMEHQTIKDATEYSRSILKEAGHGRAILSHDAATDERFKEFRSVSIYHIRSLLCVPLRLKSRIIGTVYVDTRQPGVIFSEDDLRFLEAFANQAAIAIENARLYEQARQENQYLRQAVQERYGYENIIGRSPRMREVFTLLTRVASSSLPVMIRGESGTGKELVARGVHHNSQRRDRKFFTENCAALPDTLLESELFGHARGAFTGADSSRRGLFELADGGTLFLDEVGDMSMPMQSKLLRVLQDGEFRPVGSETSRHVDVRVISATSRDLEAMIKQKAFREDLYFRLKVISVKLPPLRERREDVPLLIDHFLAKIAHENKTPKLRVDRDLMALLTRYDWPGNVRELENQVYRLALFAGGDTLTLQDAQGDTEFFGKVTLPGTRGADTRLTRDDLQRALNQANGNRDGAARILGISRATFFRKLKQFELGQKRPRLVRPPHSA